MGAKTPNRIRVAQWPQAALESGDSMTCDASSVDRREIWPLIATDGGPQKWGVSPGAGVTVRLMAELKLSTAIIAALVLTGTGVAAYAQAPVKKPSGSTTFTSQPTMAAQDPLAPGGVRKTLQWDDKTGRWGLRLDVDQPASRDAKLKEAEVGAFYRVTPSLRVGGAVGMTATPSPQKPVETDPNTPRVRVETALKF